MSRPKVYDEPRVATAIRLPTSLHEELQAVASERDVSVNFLVTRAVSTFLAELPPAGGELHRDGRPRAPKARSTAVTVESLPGTWQRACPAHHGHRPIRVLTA